MHTLNPALEAEYNNRALVPDHLAIFKRWRGDSADFRANAACVLDVAYGAAARQCLDIFHASNPRGTLMFIHGGYWRSLDKADFSFVAQPFVDAGISVVAINYRLCPSVPINDVVEDARQAFMWIQNNAKLYGLPRDRVALVGHSAGGHLLSMLYATDWAQRGGDASGIIGAMALSGVYDLKPLLHCSMNADLHLDADTARVNSPVTLSPSIGAPLHLAVGVADSAAFRGQSTILATAWPKNCTTPQVIDDANHFTIVDTLADTTHPVCQQVLRLFD